MHFVKFNRLIPTWYGVWGYYGKEGGFVIYDMREGVECNILDDTDWGGEELSKDDQAYMT